ncbi:MAG TPA: 30S ribosomal protein S15 [Campylobacterales bacterium]|nr:30S ribosomal protein S15 [Campylobacterales bacterium]
MALTGEQKSEIVSKFQRKEGDTGSPEVQIALLTTKISRLTEHLKANKKDHASRRGLLKMVGHRRRLMRYLKRTNRELYDKTIQALNIRDNI